MDARSRLIWLGLLQHIVCTYTNSSSNNNSNSSVFQLTGAQLQTLKALTSMGTPEVRVAAAALISSFGPPKPAHQANPKPPTLTTKA